jgi:hypothetical protein
MDFAFRLSSVAASKNRPYNKWEKLGVGKKGDYRIFAKRPLSP